MKRFAIGVSMLLHSSKVYGRASKSEKCKIKYVVSSEKCKIEYVVSFDRASRPHDHRSPINDLRLPLGGRPKIFARPENRRKLV